MLALRTVRQCRAGRQRHRYCAADRATDHLPSCRCCRRTAVSSGTISTISIVYPDGAAPGEQVTATVSDTTGDLSVNASVAGGGGTVTGAGTTTLSIVGTLAQVNADLATLTYETSALGSDTLTVSASGSRGGAGKAASLTVNTIGNPTIDAPPTVAILRGYATPLSVSVAEPGNLSNETFTITITIPTCLLYASDDDVTVSGADTKSLSISGSLADVNAALATLTATEPSVATDAVSINLTDSYGVDASATTTLTVIAQSPELSGPKSLALIDGVAGQLGETFAEPGIFAGEIVTATISDTKGVLASL